jgi:hypothetical protein
MNDLFTFLGNFVGYLHFQAAAAGDEERVISVGILSWRLRMSMTWYSQVMFEQGVKVYLSQLVLGLQGHSQVITEKKILEISEPQPS